MSYGLRYKGLHYEKGSFNLASEKLGRETGSYLSSVLPDTCLARLEILKLTFPPSQHPAMKRKYSAAAAAKSLQSCPTLCNPIDGSPLGSPGPGILQARTLERVATSFSNA